MSLADEFPIGCIVEVIEYATFMKSYGVGLGSRGTVMSHFDLDGTEELQGAHVSFPNIPPDVGNGLGIYFSRLARVDTEPKKYDVIYQ